MTLNIISPHIKTQIAHYLGRLEKEEDVRILFACESGSRAWGFPSPDSDYDVRFIYAHKHTWYLSLEDKRDVIEMPLHGDMDIGGWDIKKALKLVCKSNAIIWEWLQSPIVYSQEMGFKNSLLQVATPYFSKKAACHHYYSLANRVFQDTKASENFINGKKYFYILRPLLAALWIIDKNGIPPMALSQLRETQRLSRQIQGEINALLNLKKDAPEKMHIPRSPLIDGFVESTLAECQELVRSLPPLINTGIAPLEDFFRGVLR